TTILTNLVGRSLVSAITHTPASGPFGPVTTPPMSSGSMRTASPLCCPAFIVCDAVSNNAKPTAITLAYTHRFVFMSAPSRALALKRSQNLGVGADRCVGPGGGHAGPPLQSWRYDLLCHDLWNRDPV